MQDLGARIKELRKERKMTLAQLAGEKLTKGMLSLIENGKAQPSMDSLHYIASQLGINVSELMQKDDGENARQLLQQIEEMLNQIKDEYSQDKADQRMRAILDLIEPHIVKEQLKGNTYEEVRLYAIYVEMRLYLKIDVSVEPIYEVIMLYENVYAFSKIIRCYSLLSWAEFEKHKYESALSYLLEGETYIHKYGSRIDNLVKLDLYYNITVVYAAINDEQQSEKYMELAFSIAKKDQILYRLDNFYRFLFFVQLFNNEGEKSLYYLKKLRAFAEIMEDPGIDIMNLIIELHYINMVEKDYEKTVSTIVNKETISPDLYKVVEVFLNNEYGYAYWRLGKIAKAKEKLANIYIPEQNKHPLDLVALYRSFAVRSLCYYEEGDLENAKRDILYAMDGVKDFKETTYKKFIEEAYLKIMNRIN